MPQKICHKCCTQLKNSYKFIQQVCEVSEQYLQRSPHIYEETKIVEYLQETLMELPDETITDANSEIKIEPLCIEDNFNTKDEETPKEIKGEKESNVVVDNINMNNDESQEERYYVKFILIFFLLILVLKIFSEQRLSRRF